jgi:predicted secreted Zn-dependent protease
MIRVMMSALIMGLLLAQTAHAEPTVRDVVDYYEVKYSPETGFGPSLAAASPIVEKGKVFHGETKTKISWQYVMERRPDKCRFTEVSIGLGVRYTMPRIIFPYGTPRSVKDDWAKYYDKLMLHEEGHAKIAFQAARELEYGLNRMQSQRRCEDMQRKADTMGRSIVSKSDVRQVHYDEVTEHGLREGVVLPD